MKKLISAMGFIVIGTFLAMQLAYIFQPIWTEWGNYDRTEAFYDRPTNTICAVFLGPSTVVNAFIPMEIYNEYGISSYNLGSEQQPMLASYYWLEESYRRNSKTLKAVVLDPSMLRRNAEPAYYKKALDGMRFSDVKIRAYWDMTNNIEELHNYLDTIYKYHNRWSELSKTDFVRKNVEKCKQGYNFESDYYINKRDYDQIKFPELFLNEDADSTEFNQNSLYYFRKIIEFCNSKDIRLIITKPPTGDWNSSDYKATVDIAEKYKLDYFDFNFLPLYMDVGFNTPIESSDGAHLNFYGARKLSSWIGKYLSEECGIPDVRDDVGYTFLNDLAKDYDELILASIRLDACNNIYDYIIDASLMKNNLVFVAVMDDGANALSDYTRELFERSGFKKLSQLGYKDSYLSIVKDGVVRVEELSHLADEAEQSGSDMMKNDIENAQLDSGDLIIDNSEDTQRLSIVKAGYIGINTDFRLESGGNSQGNIASCKIKGIEYMPGTRGINVVVYNHRLNQVVNSAVFDTYLSEKRMTAAELWNCKAISMKDQDPEYKSMIMCNRRYNNYVSAHYLSEEFKDESLLKFIEAMMQNNEYSIIMSVMDDGSNALSDEVRMWLNDKGLEELSKLNYQDSYISIVSGSNVIYEESSHESKPLIYDGYDLNVESGGHISEGVSSIKFDDVEYSSQKKGINVVIYDNVLESVVYSGAFDTNAICPEVP